MRRLVVICNEQAPLFEKEGRGGDFLTNEKSTYQLKENLPNLPYPLFAKEGDFAEGLLRSVPQGQIFLPNQPPIPFSNAKTLLGREFGYAIYDMRAENGVHLNLEALAIVAGTIQENGTLYLLCPQWYALEQQIDQDSLRWNGNQAIATPNFHLYFKQLIHEFDFEIIDHFPELTANRDNATKIDFTLTAEQQNILKMLPLAAADIHLITAPRGRGKSTLSGKLAAKLAEQYSVLITARSHSALPNFWKGIESTQIPFIAPDKLVQLIDLQQFSPKQWLFIDEAASLPLPMLAKFCAYFEKVVLTTTTQNYEGTGRGFSLKLLPLLQRTAQQWQLTQPLRWRENDRLEAFINRLLLLDEQTSGRFSAEICKKIAFYHLLAQAHYKTTPTDLRRLFDAPDQRFYHIEQSQQLIAGCWAMDEGGLSEELTQAIWRGERRPYGNLVAQYLCFQGNLPAACRLRSLRISRIAVQPEFQRQGFGKQLVLQILQEMRPLVSPPTPSQARGLPPQAGADYISVSFGMSRELLQFWTECGFQLVQITPNAEASSGLRSAMMLYPLSPQGEAFSQQACCQFWRDLPLQPFYSTIAADLQKIAENRPLVADYTLDSLDWQNLHGFAHAQRSLSACYVSLRRLCHAYPNELAPLKNWFDTAQGKLPAHQKQWLAEIRQKIAPLFQVS